MKYRTIVIVAAIIAMWIAVIWLDDQGHNTNTPQPGPAVQSSPDAYKSFKIP